MGPDAEAPRGVADEVGVVVADAEVVNRFDFATVGHAFDRQILLILRLEQVAGLQELRGHPPLIFHIKRMLGRGADDPATHMQIQNWRK